MAAISARAYASSAGPSPQGKPCTLSFAQATRWVAFLCFTDRRFASNVRYGLINYIFLVIVKLFIDAQKGIGLLNANLIHGIALARKW